MKKQLPAGPVSFLDIPDISSHFAASANIKDVFTGYLGNSNLAMPHVHRLLEIGHIHRGRGTFMIAGKHLGFSAGDICILHPSEPHMAFYPVTCVCSWMWFDPVKLLARSPVDAGVLNIDRFAGPRFNNIFAGESYPFAAFLVENLAREFERRDAHFEDEIRGLLLALMTYLHRLSAGNDPHFPHSGPAQAAPAGSISRLSPAINLIHDRFDEEIDVRGLAAAVHVSPTAFTRLFRKLIGCSPYQYLMTYRLTRASALLRDGDASIERIAAECGFGDVSAFRRAFKLQTGVSPLAWRKKGLSAGRGTVPHLERSAQDS